MLLRHIPGDGWVSTGHPSSRAWAWCCRCVSRVHLLFSGASTRGTTTSSEGDSRIIALTSHTTLSSIFLFLKLNLFYFGIPGPKSMFFDKMCILQCPVLVAWGDKDPWEPIELGRAYGKFDTVEDFVVLPNVGHCPQVFPPSFKWSQLSTCLCFIHYYLLSYSEVDSRFKFDRFNQ